MLKNILIGVTVVVGGFVAFAATRPATYRVERKTSISAPPDVIFAQLEDFHAWESWSPWDKLDPAMKRTFEGSEKGVGAVYGWEGNKDVGKGRMTVTESRPPNHLAIRLEFMEPFAAQATTTFTLRETEGKTEVSWLMDGQNDLMGKLFGMFMDMDAQIGADFEKGLASLDAVAKSEAAKRVAAQAEAEARAKAEAAVAAQAAAAAPPEPVAQAGLPPG
jgi:uncharacterized protein YndB with AHSA1/START domain